MKKASSQKLVFLATTSVVVLVLLATGAVWFFNKPGSGNAPALAPGPLVFQKKTRASSAASPLGDAPHTYEPASFQLYKDGNVVCGAESDDLSDQFSMKHGKINEEQVQDFVDQVTNSGIDAVPLVISKKDAPYVPGPEREVYSLIRNDELKNVVWSSEYQEDKPTELSSIDQLIQQACEQHATSDYIPDTILVQMGTSPYTAGEVRTITQAEAEAVHAQAKAQIGEHVSPSGAEPQRYFYDGADAQTMIDNFFKGGTHVQIETPAGLLLATYSPTLPTTEDVDAQIRTLTNYEMTSAGLMQEEQLMQEQVGQTSSNVTDWLDDLLSGQAQATSNQADTIQINYVVFSDAVGRYDETFIRDRIRFMAIAVSRWYLVELERGYQIYRPAISIRYAKHPAQWYVRDACAVGDNACVLDRGADDPKFLERLRNEFVYDPDTIKVFLIDSNQITHSTAGGQGGYPGSHLSNATWLGWDVLRSGLTNGESEYITTTRGVRSYEFGKGAAHEVGHNLGLPHTQEINFLRRFGAPVTPQNTDIMDGANGPFSFPDDLRNNPAMNELHLAHDQRAFILHSPLDYMPYSCPFGFCSMTYTPTVPISPPPPPPTCQNGNLIRPDRFCDDGGWVVIYRNDTLFPGQVIEYWQNQTTGQCGKRQITGLADAGSGYLYISDCAQIATLQSWAQAQAINELGRKVFPIQDVGAARSAAPPRSITTNANVAHYSAKSSALRTWSSWEKPHRVDGPYGGAYNFVNWFIPDPHGLYNIYATKNYNFYGNIWGFIDGHYVAASNMGAYGKGVGLEQAFLFGPHENPAGNIHTAFRNGKTMKVCWNVKDILAAETNNTQHSVIRLRVTSNGGAVMWTPGPYTFFVLSGTEFKQYCHDNIRPPMNSGLKDLEFPVTYVNGSVAVESITRTIYWPAGTYSIKLPNYSGYSAGDLTIKQSGVPSTLLTNKQCQGVNFNGQRADGCKMNKNQSVGITSTMFEAPKANATKELCITGDLPLDPGQEQHQFYAHIYAANQNQPAKYFRFSKRELMQNNRYRYCEQTNLKTFNRVVISTSADSPAILYDVTVK